MIYRLKLISAVSVQTWKQAVNSLCVEQIEISHVDEVICLNLWHQLFLLFHIIEIIRQLISVSLWSRIVCLIDLIRFPQLSPLWKSCRHLLIWVCFLCVCVQVRRLLCDSSRHKLLVLAGQCVEQSGDIVLQKGCFSLKDFIQIFADEEVRQLMA